MCDCRTLQCSPLTNFMSGITWDFSLKLDFHNFSEKFPFSLAFPVPRFLSKLFFKLDQKSFHGTARVKEMLYRQYCIFLLNPLPA